MAQEKPGWGTRIGIVLVVISIISCFQGCSSGPVQQSPVYVQPQQQLPPEVLNPSPTPEYGMNGGVKCTTNQNPISGEIITNCNPN